MSIDNVTQRAFRHLALITLGRSFEDELYCLPFYYNLIRYCALAAGRVRLVVDLESPFPSYSITYTHTHTTSPSPAPTSHHHHG